MMISLGIFSFFQNLIFWAVSRIKAQKIVQNEKQQSHLLRATSQEQYSI